MKAYALVEILRKSRKPVLTTNDLAKFTRGKRKYASLLAHRMMQRGWLLRVERGKYMLPETPVWAVASHLVFPSYISFLSGFYLNELTEQLPRTVAVVVTKPRKRLDVQGVPIYFVTFPPSRFGSYRKISVDEWPVFVAEPERAVADALYLPEHCAPAYIQEALRSKKINIKKLIRQVKESYPSRIGERLRKAIHHAR